MPSWTAPPRSSARRRTNGRGRPWSRRRRPATSPAVGNRQIHPIEAEVVVRIFRLAGEVFNDQVLATAILDRLLHHATTVNIKGDSYRLREKKKAGLLGRKPKPVDAEDAAAPA